MRMRSLGGLLVLALVGVAVAWLFHRVPEPSQAESTHARLDQSFSQNLDSRGRIVPLVVNEGFSGAAFISSEPMSPSEMEGDLPAYHVLRQPAIHRDTALSETETPQLNSSFPHQLRLLGIQDSTQQSISPNVETRTVAVEPLVSTAPFDANSEAHKESVSNQDLIANAPTASRHIIVDGDTLPHIAFKYYGDESRANDIYAMNRERIPSFELLTIGIEIDLPTDIAH